MQTETRIHPFTAEYAAAREEAGEKILDDLSFGIPGANVALRAYVRAAWTGLRVPEPDVEHGAPWIKAAVQERLRTDLFEALNKMQIPRGDRRDAVIAVIYRVTI